MHKTIGIDDGFNTTITYSDTGELKIAPTKLRIGASHAITMAGADNRDAPAQYKTRDEQGSELIFSVGANTSDDIVHDDYPLSAQCRVMIHHGLHQLEHLNNSTVNVCTGLPIRKYYKRNGEKNQRLIDEKTRNVLQPVQDATKAKSIKIEKSIVMPESLSAIWDMVITESRNPNNPLTDKPDVKLDKAMLKSHIAFFDVGGRTTDIAIWSGGQINKGEFDTINAGMEDIYREIRDHLRDETGLDAIPDSHIRSAYNNKQIQMGGVVFDLTDTIHAAIQETVAKIKNKAASVIGTKAQLIDRVVFLGGGAQALYQSGLAGMYSNQRMLDMPIAVNARSNYKYYRYIHAPNAD